MTRGSLPRLLMAAAAASVLLTPLSGGEVAAQTTPLREGQTLSGSLAKGDTARYSIQAGKDYFVFGEVEQTSVDVVVRVLNPKGDQIGRFDGPARGAEQFSGTPDDAGVYVVEVSPFEDEVGDYSITLRVLEPVETDPEKLANQLFFRYDSEDSPGVAIQVWRDGRTLYSKGWGMANLTYGIPFEPDTPTNIGSTSKQFTAFAIMLQAERGKLSLDDDIREHITELPAFDQVVTVRHLITHTSGLREFLNMLGMAGRRLDHGDWIDRSELIGIVQRQPALQNVPGAEWNYNNTAYGLAALIVERTSDQDFHVFMEDNVFGPLGMTQTMVRPSREDIVPGMSEGYTPGGRGFRVLGDLGGAVGAGGIYSTVEDLQIWIENYANPRIGTPEIFEEMMTSYVLNDGEETGYGYGLFIDEQGGMRRVHHGGADVAHRSMLVYYPEINAGITTQSNHAGFDGSAAFQLGAAFFRDAMEEEVEEESSGEDGSTREDGSSFDAVAYDSEDFDAFVGRYSLDERPSLVMTLSRVADTLYAAATGQEQRSLTPTSDSTFALSGVDAVFLFARNDEGEIDGLTLLQNGEHHATRLDSEDTAWEPSVEDLADYVGRYFSEELETFYTIVLEKEELVVQHRRLDEATLASGEDEDQFSGGGLEYAFERDRNGGVIGFYIANGRTRDIRFERVR